ncbi:hypothetical protein BZA77DRAFT_320703 [Pyronema omphalodes]|nr:hypothetical protein BZA77DRAFT_320703 [Pyronema omphalodes]
MTTVTTQDTILQSERVTTRLGAIDLSSHNVHIVDEIVDDNEILYLVQYPQCRLWEPRTTISSMPGVLDAWKEARPNGKRRRGHEINDNSKSTVVSPDVIDEHFLSTQEVTPSPASEGPAPLSLAQLVAGHKGSCMGIAKTPKVSQRTKRPPAAVYVPKPTPQEILDHPDYKVYTAKLAALPGPPITLVNEVDLVPSPSVDFEFLDELKLAPDVPVYHSDFLFGCDCPEEGCDDPTECSCLREFPVKRFAYNKHGKVVVGREVCIVECNEKCSCGPQCINRVVQNGRKVPLEIFRCEKTGWGLRCPERLKKGTFVELYLGEVIGPAETIARVALADELGESYLYDLDKFTFKEDNLQDEISVGMDIDHNDHYTIDGRLCGSVARFINHSCDPNLDTYAVARNRRDYKVYDLAFFATKDIEPYEELTFSYTYWVPTVKGRKQDEEKDGWPCYCGADNCMQRLWS